MASKKEKQSDVHGETSEKGTSPKTRSAENQAINNRRKNRFGLEPKARKTGRAAAVNAEKELKHEFQKSKSIWGKPSLGPAIGRF